VSIDATLMAAFEGWFRRETILRTVSEREAIAFAHHAIYLMIAGRAGW